MPRHFHQKKLLNNGRVRAAWASLKVRFDVAEQEADALEVEELVRLCESDKQLARAIQGCDGEYRSVFRSVEKRLVEELQAGED